VIKFVTSQWDDRADQFMSQQGKWRNAKGTEYCAGVIYNHDIFIIYSSPRTRTDFVEGERWKEVNVFSDWRKLSKNTNLTKDQKRKVRNYLLYQGMSWAFREPAIYGVWGRIFSGNKGVNALAGHFANKPLISTGKYSEASGNEFLEWRYTREEFVTGPIPQLAKDSVYNF